MIKIIYKNVSVQTTINEHFSSESKLLLKAINYYNRWTWMKRWLPNKIS